jgi:hypothetical protein
MNSSDQSLDDKSLEVTIPPQNFDPNIKENTEALEGRLMPSIIRSI